MLLIIGVGIIIGLVLGLTGAGGSIVALPLLILLLDIAPQDATVIALCAVATSATFGALTRLSKQEIVWLPAIMFSLIGSLFTPLGSWLNRQLPESGILIGFTLIVFMVAYKMWVQASRQPLDTKVARAQFTTSSSDFTGAFCRMNNQQDFQFGPRCFLGMIFGASVVGVLSGLFGVGGGFIIVPTLMFLTGIHIQQAVASSLVIISAVSGSALLSHFVQGSLTPSPMLLYISIGGLIGMLLGLFIGRKIGGPALQKTFSISIVLLASLVIAKHYGIL